MLVHREPKILLWLWTSTPSWSSSWSSLSSYHHHHQNYHPHLQGPQKYRQQQPSDRRGPSQEEHQALADVVVEDYQNEDYDVQQDEDYDVDHDEDYDVYHDEDYDV